MYTDGVGEISPLLAREAFMEYQKNGSRKKRTRLNIPSAFQMRLGGSKGVLVVNHELPGRVIRLRKSQIKYDAPDSLELCKSLIVQHCLD
jgi:RNA-dependent RNA polymerase